MKNWKEVINYGAFLAVFSGLFAALASTSAKLVFNTDIVQQFCQLVSSSSSIALFQSIICSEALTNVLWAICVGFVILFNVLMWTTFTKALQYFSSTVEASATNTASSFLFSAILGWIIFSEHLNLQWFAGFMCIISGLYLIQKENIHQEKIAKKTE
ncbi:transmembrane protein 42 [Octopus sinensis]|uniref:Transmembrane protein 42 n=1 Tax=Octopus sinensis TaxID=2607531 RepID=A0A6P7TBV9_9MOLL|nr:transmembrane protein 42 [Octopus sinensis]